MILDKFELGDIHELRGGYRTREEISAFGDSMFHKKLSKEDIEDLFYEKNLLSVVFRLVYEGFKGVLTIKDKINEDFETFFNKHYNQKKINLDRLKNLPFDGEYYYIDISNTHVIAKLTEEYKTKDVVISESTCFNFGRLYFDNKNILKKVQLTEGILPPREELDKIESNYESLGFKKNYEGDLEGSIALRTVDFPQ